MIVVTREIVVGLLAVGAFLMLACGNALDEDHEPRDGAPRSASMLDALLFLLCLVGILHERAKKRADEDG